jgi:hypothetical protein
MTTSNNDNSVLFANWAVALLVTGLFVLIVGVAAVFSSGPPQTTAKTCLFLCCSLEGVASVLGVIGRRNARAIVAIVGGIILSALSGWMLVVLVQLLRHPLGI